MNLRKTKSPRSIILIIPLFLCGLMGFGQSINKLEESLEYSRGLDKAEVYTKLAKAYKSDYQYQTAIKYYRKSLQIRASENDKAGVGKNLNSIGIAFRLLENYDSAFFYYELSLRVKEELKDFQGIAATSNNMGVLFKKMEKWDQALEYYFKSLDAKEQIGDKAGISKTLNNIGIIYRELGDNESSLEYYQRSLKIKEELGDKAGIAKTNNNIGVAYDFLGNYSEAIAYHEKSLDLKRSLNDKKGVANSLNNIGKVYSKLNMYRKALEYYYESLKIKGEISDQKGLAILHNNIANSLIDLERYDQASLHLDSSFHWASNTGDLEAQQKNFYFRSKLHKRLGEFRQALEFKEEYLVMKDSVLSIKNQQGAMEIAALKELEKRERELLFKQEKKDQLFRTVAYSVLIGLLVFSIVLFSRFRLKRKLGKELEKSRTRFSMAVEASKSGIYEWDIRTNEAYVSQRWKEVLGFPKEDDLKVDLEYYLSLVHPDDAERAGANVQRAIEKGSTYSNEIRMRLKTGLYRWFLDTGIVTYENGQPSYAFGSIIDIHDKKLTEQRLLQNNIKLEKINEELDRFVYSASHDMRAPLSTLLGLLRLAKSNKDSEEVEAYLELMGNQINIMEEFIRKVTEYSRNSTQEIHEERFEVGPVICDAITFHKFLIRESGIECKDEVQKGLILNTDKTRFKVILNNLLTNAIKYHNPHIQERLININAYSEGENFILEVQDNGIGIKPEYLEKIFQMFFRGSENSEGSGLGLYIVKETLDKLNGTISCTSVPSEGTTFKVTLPKWDPDNLVPDEFPIEDSALTAE